MKYYIIAGEASGDLHAANLMRELKKIDPLASFRYWGGDLMQQQGGQLVRHYRDTAVMGIIEVVKNLPAIIRNIRFCKADLIKFKPDAVILVDYPGFNLRVAKFARNRGFKVFYYIAPKVWAWNQGRVHKIKQRVDKVFTIFPFETDFYSRFGIPVIYTGNPLLDAIDSRPNKSESRSNFTTRMQLGPKPIIAMLPGSREQEVQRLLPDMLSLKERFGEYQFVIAGAPSLNPEYYATFLDGHNDVKVVFNETYSLLQHARAAMVASGTATLEAALLNCPQVVCYKMWGGSFSDFLVKKIIIKVPFISLVNLIMNREVVKELFQATFSIEILERELDKLCNDETYRSEMLKGYNELACIMGEPGSSRLTAVAMWELMDVSSR